jgi:hypothetical protein
MGRLLETLYDAYTVASEKIPFSNLMLSSDTLNMAVPQTLGDTVPNTMRFLLTNDRKKYSHPQSQDMLHPFYWVAFDSDAPTIGKSNVSVSEIAITPKDMPSFYEQPDEEHDSGRLIRIFPKQRYQYSMQGEPFRAKDPDFMPGDWRGIHVQLKEDDKEWYLSLGFDKGWYSLYFDNQETPEPYDPYLESRYQPVADHYQKAQRRVGGLTDVVRIAMMIDAAIQTVYGPKHGFLLERVSDLGNDEVLDGLYDLDHGEGFKTVRHREDLGTLYNHLLEASSFPAGRHPLDRGTLTHSGIRSLFNEKVFP